MASPVNKILGQVRLTDTSNTTVYTVAGEADDGTPKSVEAWITVASKSGSAVQYRVWLVESGESAGDTNFIAYDVTIKNTFGPHRIGPIHLDEGQFVVARADTANELVVTVTGVEKDYENVGAR